MSLKPLEPKEILDFVRKSRDVGMRYLLITLIDGNHLIGRNGYHEGSKKKNHVILSFFKGSISIDTFVPFNRIAGISLWNVEQEMEFTESEDVDEEDLNQESLDSILRTELLEKAKHYDFDTHISMLAARLTTEKPTLGKPNFSGFTLLYCNDELIKGDSFWERVKTVKMIIPGIGVGADVDVERKIRSLAKKKVVQKISSLSNLKGNSNKKIVVRGFIQILAKSNGSDWTETMDGKEWVYMALSEDRVKEFSELDNMHWCIFAGSKDKWIYPLKSIDKIEEPVNVYGEFIEMTIGTDNKEKNGFLKASVAAFIQG